MDHQLGIDRGAADAAVERLQLGAHPLEIEEAVDPAQQVIGRHMVVEAEIVEQLRRRHLRAHLDPAPRSNSRMESHALARATAD